MNFSIAVRNDIDTIVIITPHTQSPVLNRNEIHSIANDNNVALSRTSKCIHITIVDAGNNRLGIGQGRLPVPNAFRRFV